MLEHRTHSCATPRQGPRESALRLGSDALCFVGGVVLALGIWLRPRSLIGGGVLIAGIVMGSAGLVLAGLVGIHEVRAWGAVAADETNGNANVEVEAASCSSYAMGRTEACQCG